MNWGKIAAYAVALLAAQGAVGFLEGAFAPVRTSATLISCLASFMVCGIIFAHLVAHQPSKPFAHAWAALALQIAAAVALWGALAVWLGSIPIATVALEWLALSFALVAGTALGLSLGRSDGHPADA